MIHLITYLTRIQFGPGAISLLRSELEQLGVSRPLIVSDKGVVAAGLVERAARAGLGDCPVFSDCPENPTQAAARKGVACFREHRCDCVVAIGGGSPLDLAKVIALQVTHPGDLAQYAAILGGVAKITAAKPPVIAVPTTSGTGSEVGRAALITLDDHRKLGFISPFMIPHVAICDPELTLGLPPRLTAATGMDAVTHCIETFLSPRWNPPAEAIALDGLRRAIRSIRRATADGSALEARTEMAMAALEGGMTFQKGLGGVHALSHPLGGLAGHKLHHGMLNAVLLPHLLRFCESAVGPKLPALREAMGLAPASDVAEAIASLNADLGMPKRLSEMGLRREDLAGIPAAAMLDHSTPTNARPITEADYAAILDAAL
jgi:alcohol dehydrogenase class IV